MNWVFIAGVVLFALGILFSICLHEAGHMMTAKAFGMKVTRYFVGFGPTLWSFKRGETEYGVKAIPAGGFVKIIGMAPNDPDVQPGDEPRAFWNKPVWQRTIVLAAGSITHFILGFFILWIAAVFVGLPNVQGAPGARAEVGGVSTCAQRFDRERGEHGEFVPCSESDTKTPAKAAGIAPGDVITAVNGEKVHSWEAMSDKLKADKEGDITLTVERDDKSREVTLTPVVVERPKADAKISEEQPRVKPSDIVATRVIGVEKESTVTVGPIEGVVAATDYTGQVFKGTFVALKKFPEKIPKLVEALTNEERDPETPVSVVGASRIGGEAAEAGVWPIFFFLLASLNVFIGIFNLVPLLPLDGGHVAIAWFQKVRSWWAAKRGRPDPGFVDYDKLMPITYAVILVFGAISLLTIITDIVNPITLSGS
ncbi:MAG: site-2 protease family protein [Corynebacteriales bacterium]|nr:site-2 protease family protein [Mycobacteriales bacterium]